MESSPSGTVLSPNYSSLDFFSLVGIDSHNPDSPAGSGYVAAHTSLDTGHSSSALHPYHDYNSQYHTPSHSAPQSVIDGHGIASPHDDEPLDDPSPISLDNHSSSGTSRPRAAGPSSSQPQKQSSQSHSQSHPASRRASRPMDVDNAGSGSGHNTPSLDTDLMQMDVSGATYDAIQAGILQHQLEAIHMQSPFLNPNNPTSPYGAMAQMFLTSPPGQPPSRPQSDSSRPDQLQRKFSGANVPGVLTPGPSGDIHPESRMDLMSPMQLEMLTRGEMIEGMENVCNDQTKSGADDQFHTVPLLSPALSHSASTYASPVANVAFGSAKDATASMHALEQLQVEQRQFQEQLAALQERHSRLQATAAAVAAAQMQPARHNAQSGVSSAHSSAAMSTPSPGSYFSPLTSPALEPAVSRSAALRAAAAHLSPALHGQQHQRTPHPLSALSSPALNPVGSSGGAQQTLSPALVPQTSVDGADPDYLNALQGIFDGPSESAYQSSPIIGPTSNVTMSPVVNGNVTGPHRGSLNAKSRPSPMMKPTNHRSHARQTSNSVPTSPMAFKMPQSGMGFLPPAAIDQRGVQQQQQQQQQASSTHSTPSPVDLAQIMPPPPVPSQGSRPKSLMPMTPATLMNLGKPEMEAESSKSGAAAAAAAAPPVRAAAKKATTAIAPATQPAPKRGSRLVPSGGAAAAKRALAIRPSGAVGVRAATKGAAAAAAAAASNTEPESRRTSHKAAEQKRRDSLKAGFDELRLLLPAINTEALDPESGEPIPGSSAPRLLPKSSLVPDDNPNRGVSKVALLKFSNEYIVRLHNKVEKRDGYIDKLRDEIRRLRVDPSMPEVRGEDGEDLLDMDMLEGEEDDLGGSEDEDEMDVDSAAVAAPSKKKTASVGKSPALGPTRRPAPKTKKRGNE